MSYRPENQSVEKPLTLIIQGIELFNNVVNARINANEWNENHIQKINDLRNDFNKIYPILVKLLNDTW